MPRRRATPAPLSIDTVIDQAPFSIQRFSADGTCIQTNPAYAEMWGVLGEHATGWNIRAHAAADLVGLRDAVDRVFAGETVHIAAFEWQPARLGLAGAPRWFELWMCPINDAAGGLREVVFVTFDLTDRLRTQAELTASQRQLARLVGDVDGIVWEADAATLTFTFVSPQAERVLGYPAGDWLNDSFWLAHVHPEDRDAAVACCSAATARGENHTFEYRMRGADGRVVWIRDIVTVVAEPGAPVRLRGIMLDVTAQKAIEAEHRRAQQQIETLNRELEQRVLERTAELEVAVRELEAFGYSVSHDLRAPLRTIDGFSRILREEHAAELSPAASRHLDRVRAAATRMNALIDQLLELSRVARAEVRRRKVDVSKLARAVVGELRRAEPARRVEVNVADGLTAHADPTLVRAVLENLLSNAWKYTARAAAACVEVGLAEPAGVPAYFVRDNGAGFDMAHADKLFVPFQRLHRDEDFAGTGVGLATVHRIVRRHGGEVWADAAVGRGATFYFTLQRAGGRGTRAPAG
ncbi:MAG: PAS domain-containing protein [Deltaproteobacteria bacterium]|nr:PAS domain-containing protein [Deltaproteobacteria bacterium]